MVARYLWHGPCLRRVTFRPAFAAKPYYRPFSNSPFQFKRYIAPINWRELRGHGLKLSKQWIATRIPDPGYQSRKINIIEYVANGLMFLGGVGSMIFAASFSSTESPEVALYNPTIPTIWTNPLWVFHEQTKERRDDSEVEEGLQYAPLDEPFQTRVLILHPGDEDQPIECSLKRATLHREPIHSEYPGSFSGVRIEGDSKSQFWLPTWKSHHDITTYEAVSYAWGDLTVPQLIQCDGKPRVISLNLYQALHSFRHVYEPRILWVDALCINQNDNLEKAHQVSIMGEIYAGARRVLIWLGCGTDLEKAFGLLMRGQVSQLNLIQHLMSAPWFSRVWCVQELARAADPVVTVGKRMAPWDLYVRRSRLALKEIRKNPQANQDDHLGHAEILDDIRSRYENVQKRRFRQPGRRQSYSSAWKAGGASLVELLFLTRDFKATDPRDKIFALVGIASDVQEQDIEVFPRYDLPTDVVYRQLALWYLIRKRNFGIFSFGGDRTPLREFHTDDLPSWVPDLTRPNAFTPFQKLPHGYNYSKDNFYNVFNYLEEWLPMLQANEDGRIEKLQFFHADVHNPVCAGWADWRDRSPLARLPPIKVSHAGHVLHLKGKHIGTVSRLTDRSSGQPITDITTLPKDTLEPSQKWLRDCWEIVFSVMLESQTDRQLAIIFEGAWRSIICDTTNAVERDLGLVAGDEVGNGFRASFNKFLHMKLKKYDEDFRRHSHLNQIRERAHDTTTQADANLSHRQMVESLPYHADFWRRFIEPKTRRPQRNTVDSMPELGTHPPNASSVRTSDIHRTLLRAAKEGINKTFTYDAAKIPESASAVVSSYRFWHRGRRFGIADNGGFICTPESAREGDVICMFDGGRVPFVLRPHEDGLYSLVGECYVHGLMHGEWKRPNGKLKFQTTSFALK